MAFGLIGGAGGGYATSTGLPGGARLGPNVPMQAGSVSSFQLSPAMQAARRRQMWQQLFQNMQQQGGGGGGMGGGGGGMAGPGSGMMSLFDYDTFLRAAMGG